MALTEAEKWKAVISSDSAYDGVFYYGVKTTGILCRPSCKSKVPKRDNVMFFNSLEEACAYGLRPCKRCRPELIEFKPMLELLAKAKQIYDTNYSDSEKLSKEINKLGISQNHLIHLFREQYRLTPVGYVNKLRIEKAKELLLGNEHNILNIALQCGFGSLSTFYELFKKQVGATPRAYRKLKGTGDSK